MAALARRSGRCRQHALVGAKLTRDVQRVAVEETRLGIPAAVRPRHHSRSPDGVSDPACRSGRLRSRSLGKRTARASALEATADGVNFNYAPMLDVSRDPRWGRIAEGPGEDPWLASRFRLWPRSGVSKATISEKPKEYSGDRQASCCLWSCRKRGRDYHSVDISERTFLEIYMPPFKAAVEAGVGGDHARVSTILPASP